MYNMKLYVTKDAKNTGELITLDIEDVIYIESGERNVVIHTMDGEYYPLMPTLSTFEHHMKPYGFNRLDRTNLVNSNKIRKYDEVRSLVFFEDHITEKSKFGTVSSSAKKLVTKMFREQSL